MENPAVWNRATNAISKALGSYRKDLDPDACGPTEPHYVATCLEQQGLLSSEGLEAVGMRVPPPPQDELLASLAAYMLEHPEQRFWQALRNWSGQDYILARNDTIEELPGGRGTVKENSVDTFYWTNRTGLK